jgi:hypothetical protein
MQKAMTDPNPGDMTTRNPYAPPQSEVRDHANVEESPALWNPRAAANWSLVFSPVFGATVQMKNWRALGKPDEAERSKTWALGSLGFFVVLALIGGFAPGSKAIDLLSNVLPLALLITWYYANGKAQQAFVVARFGTSYRKKGWLKPLGLAVLAMLAFIVALAIVAFVAGTLAGTE